MFSMHGKVVIITGGTGGIGYQVARGLAEAGACIALWYHRSSCAEQLATSLEKDFGVKAKGYQCSVQNFEEVRLLLSRDLIRPALANLWCFV